MLMVVFIGGHPGTDFTGGIEGGGAPPNNWAIVLNMTPQNLVVGGKTLGAKHPNSAPKSPF